MSVFHYHDQEQIPSGRIAGRYVSAACPALNGPAGVAVTAVPSPWRAGHRARMRGAPGA
jgi:hypothetical protein